MSTLNAANSPYALSFHGGLYEASDATDTEADQILDNSSSHFSERYNSGWQTDFYGTFSDYRVDSGDTEAYPHSATVNSIKLSFQEATVYEWSGLSWTPGGDASSEEDAANLLSGNDTIISGSANDILAGFAGNDSIDGGAGRDEAHFFGARSAYSVVKNADTLTVSGGSDGTDTLTHIERVRFSDKSIALDVDATGNAGQAMELIGVLAPNLLNDLGIRGAIISLFDQGHSMRDLSQLALDGHLLPTTSNAALANAVYKNVIGSDASQDMTNALVNYINGHGMADFVATIAGLHINVDLVGLQQSGLEYI